MPYANASPRGQNRTMDPRVVRTRAQLQATLLELARAGGLESVTIGEIADRAGVNRSTFYQHYADKETLLADALDSVVGEVVVAAGGETDERGIPVELTAYLTHVHDHAEIYREILGYRGSTVVMARLRARLEAIVVASLGAAPGDPYPGVPVDVVAAGLSGAAMGVVAAWLGRSPTPTVDVAAQWMWTVLAPHD